MKLSDEEKKEFLASARSAKLREDLSKVAQNRHNPLLVDGEVDMDRLLTFLTECNAFFGHQRKPRRRIIDKNMRL